MAMAIAVAAYFAPTRCLYWRSERIASCYRFELPTARHRPAMLVNTIQDLQALREGVDIEFKRASGANGRGELPKDFWPTYSAMANTEGGDVYLGVGELADKSLQLVGLNDLEKVRQDLFNQVNNRQKISVNLLTDKNVETLVVDGLAVLRVHIPRSSRRQRPVYVNENVLRGTYVRRNEGDYQLDEFGVKRMLAEAAEDSRDGHVLPHFDLHDLDLETVASYRIGFASRSPTHPFVSQPLNEFLRSINAWGRNRETGEEGLTLGGLLMFGKLNSILEAVPNYVVDYQERAAAKTETRWIDRITTDGSWSGNLYDFYLKVFKKLTADLKVPFRLDNDSRRQQQTPIHEALQEALVNTLIHADYSGRVSVFVAKRPDLFGFRNPGLMRVPMETARVGGVSDCRNRIIQKMFQHAGAGDQAGSGVPRIYSVWKSQSWREPHAYEKHEPDQTLFELRMASLLPHEEVEKLERKYGERFRWLSHEDRLVVVCAAMESIVDHRRVCELTNLHPADVTKLLGKLVREGFLRPGGRGRGTFYWSAEAEEPAEFYGFTEAFAANDERVPSNDAPQDGGSLQPSSISHPGMEVPTSNLDRLRHTLAQVHPNGLPRRLREGDMRALILRLLAEDYVSLRDLADVLERSAEFVRSAHVKPLVETGVVRPKYSNPSHPEQAYKVVMPEPPPPDDGSRD